MFLLHVKKSTKRHFFRYSATPPHPTAKQSRGWLRVGVRKPRLVLLGFRATRNKGTAVRRHQGPTAGGVERRARPAPLGQNPMSLAIQFQGRETRWSYSQLPREREVVSTKKRSQSPDHGTRFETMAILVKALKCVTKRLHAFP